MLIVIKIAVGNVGKPMEYAWKNSGALEMSLRHFYLIQRIISYGFGAQLNSLI